jgi:hypothetical protein
MRGAHAAIFCLLAALALSGYMRTPAAAPTEAMRVVVPLGTPLGPGNTVLVGERWF